MNLPLNVNVIWGTNSKVVGCLYLPIGVTLPVGCTISGASFSGTVTIPSGGTAICFGLAESPTNNYSATITLAGTNLPDANSYPYQFEARAVNNSTDLTSLSAMATAFAAPVGVAWTRDSDLLPAGGIIKNGGWAINGDSGSGDIPINHNTGGADALRYVDSGGNGVAGGTVVLNFGIEFVPV